MKKITILLVLLLLVPTSAFAFLPMTVLDYKEFSRVAQSAMCDNGNTLIQIWEGNHPGIYNKGEKITYALTEIVPNYKGDLFKGERLYVMKMGLDMEDGSRNTKFHFFHQVITDNKYIQEISEHRFQDNLKRLTPNYYKFTRSRVEKSEHDCSWSK